LKKNIFEVVTLKEKQRALPQKYPVVLLTERDTDLMQSSISCVLIFLDLLAINFVRQFRYHLDQLL
jgi:hypothetical protein